MLKKILFYFLKSAFTLFVVAILVFGLYQLMPGDGVEATASLLEKSNAWEDRETYEKDYQQAAINLGIDKPVFYFSVQSYPTVDTFSKIILPRYKNGIKELLVKKVPFSEALRYVFLVKNIEKNCYNTLKDSTLQNTQKDSIALLLREASLLYDTKDLEAILLKKEYLWDLGKKNTLTQNALLEWEKQLALVKSKEQKGIAWQPFLTVYGTDCQFHHWFIQLLSGNFGHSYKSHRPVWEEIRDAVRWTLMLNGASLLLIFVLGIALGLRAAAAFGQKLDQRLLGFSLVMDAIPAFWVATIVLVFLTNPYYHLQVFPNAGLGDPPYNATFGEKLLYALPHFIAPIFCIVLTSFSFIFKQTRSSAWQILQEDYIRTARAKGMDEKKILLRHVLPNAIFPIITLIGVALPELIVGSVLLETVFNIPGMGRLAAESIIDKNFPVLIAIVLLTAVINMVGTTLSDVLYRIFNKKIELK
jgi:peptide/nickel transport system permease protein